MRLPCFFNYKLLANYSEVTLLRYCGRDKNPLFP